MVRQQRQNLNRPEQIMYNVCHAMQLNYYRRLQQSFSKWQLLAKLLQESQGRNGNGVQRDGGTETKLLLLKSVMRDRIIVRQKQAFKKWVR